MFLFDELLRLQHRNCTALQTNPVFLAQIRNCLLVLSRDLPITWLSSR